MLRLNPGSPPAGISGGDAGGGGWTNHEVWQRIQGLINPVPPEGYSGDTQGVEELDAETLIKVPRAVKALEESWLLLATDFVVGARWLDVRKVQDPHRRFGSAPTATFYSAGSAMPAGDQLSPKAAQLGRQ